MFEALKKIKQQHVIKHFLSLKRVKVMHNLNSIKTIGILFNVTTEEHWDLINNFSKQLTQKGKSVFLLGKVEDKDKLNFIITNVNANIIHKKGDFNFYGIPKLTSITPFLNRKYDILIDATCSSDFFSRYVAVRSLADFKIACDKKENENIFDFLIKIKEDVSSEFFLQQVIHYLTLINK